MIKIHIAFLGFFLLLGCSSNKIKEDVEKNLFNSFNNLNLEGKADNYKNFNNLKKGDYDKVKKT